MVKNKFTWQILALIICLLGCRADEATIEDIVTTNTTNEPLNTIPPNEYVLPQNTLATNDDDLIAYRANWMASSWGITQRVDGGYKLDASADLSNWQEGAEEIVANIPMATHVITSFTHPAHGYLFTLRTNNNVDVSAIHADMVPTLENEQVILDVINIYRKAGKKIILYLNVAGPSMAEERGDTEIQNAWEEYYQEQWNGDEAAAWRHLVLGYAERFSGLIDGYWLDNARKLPGELSDFISMLRSVDPTMAIGVNEGQAYFTDENEGYLYVDTDGLNDGDETNYKIVKHNVNNEYMDFTGGHVTPLGRGAPPNSWAYEEYTLPDMVKSPLGTYDGNTYAIKHAWFPIRDSWSGASADLIFEVEQAYRFVRTITDAGATMTWSTTQKKVI